ncbi:hypothetical protein MY11210_001959 [Beauveria gryllotalpidicola]
MATEVPLNVVAVVKLAMSLRERPCMAQIEGAPLLGSFNKVVIVKFDDDLKWAFRTPRPDGVGKSLPAVLVCELMRSEVATLDYLARYSSIPVPRVIHHSCTDVNSIGVPYILMTVAPGVPFAEHLSRVRLGGRKNPSEAAAQVMRQLGKISFDLSKLRFDKIGSLWKKDDSFGVGEIRAPAFVSQDRHALSMETQRGPFPTEQDYYKALTETFFGHVQDLYMSHHFLRSPVPELADYPDARSYELVLDRWNDFMAVGDKIDSSENRIQYHTAGKIIQDIIPQFSVREDDVGFPLGHASLNSRHVFVDIDGNITCITNWQYSSTMPLGQLLMTPALTNHRYQPAGADHAAFRTGFDAAAKGTAIRPPVSWLLTDVLWQYMRWVSLDSYNDFGLFEALLKWHPEFAGRDPLRLIDELRGRADIVEARERLKAGEREEAEMLSDEKAYFEATKDGARIYRIARILTERFALRRQILGREFWMATLSEDFGSANGPLN